MKRTFYLFAIILLGFTLTMSNKARADRDDNKGNNGHHGNDENNNPGSTLPINNGIVFLTLAGIVIGIVAVKKVKVNHTVNA